MGILPLLMLDVDFLKALTRNMTRSLFGIENTGKSQVLLILNWIQQKWDSTMVFYFKTPNIILLYYLIWKVFCFANGLANRYFKFIKDRYYHVTN